MQSGRVFWSGIIDMAIIIIPTALLICHRSTLRDKFQPPSRYSIKYCPLLYRLPFLSIRVLLLTNPPQGQKHTHQNHHRILIARRSKYIVIVLSCVWLGFGDKGTWKPKQKWIYCSITVFLLFVFSSI